MKNLKKIGALALSAVFLMTFSGCALLPAQAPTKAPEEVLKEAATNFYSIHSGGYEVLAKGNALTSADENFDFDLKFDGIFDATEKTSPKFTLKADVEVKPGEEPAFSVGAELRLTKDFVYGLLSSLETGETALPVETQDLIGQWYKMAVPAGAFEGLNLPPGEGEELTPEQQQAKDLLAKSSFFKDVEYIGTESIYGASSYHYSAVLDKEGVKAFLTEAAQIQGTVLSEADKADMENALNSTEMTGEVWVGTDDMIMRKVKANVKMTTSTGDSVNLDIEFSLKDVNKAQTVKEPADTKDFDPIMLFGAAAMMQGGLPAAESGDDLTGVEGLPEGFEVPDGF